MKKIISILSLVFFLILSSSSLAKAADYSCGDKIGYVNSVPDGANCNCNGAGWEAYDIYGGLWITIRGVCCGWVEEGTVHDQCLSANPSDTTAFCGETYPSSGAGSKTCICGGGGGINDMGGGQTCCGWLLNGSCSSTDVGLNDASVSAQTLASLNPLSSSTDAQRLSTPGGIISKALGSFIFPIAGIILFVVLLLGGFQMLTGATNSKSLDEGKQRITAAIMGFLLLFAAYWIAQLLELIFGIRILS